MDIKYFNGLKNQAIKNLETDIKTMTEFLDYICKWWRDKYSIPKTDQRYLDMTPDDMVIEFYEDYYSDPTKAEELLAIKGGFDSVKDMLEDEARRDMGDEYSEIITNSTEEVGLDGENSEEEEIVESFIEDEEK